MAAELQRDLIRESLRDNVRGKRLTGWYTYGGGAHRRWCITGPGISSKPRDDDAIIKWIANQGLS